MITARMVKAQLLRLGIVASCRTEKKAGFPSKIKATVSQGSFPSVINQEQVLISMEYSIEFYGICAPNNLSPKLPSQMKEIHSIYLIKEL